MCPKELLSERSIIEDKSVGPKQIWQCTLQLLPAILRADTHWLHPALQTTKRVEADDVEGSHALKLWASILPSPLWL